MLPDFPGIKRDLDRLLNELFRQLVNAKATASGRVRAHTMFEGTVDTLSREGAAPEQTEIHEASSQFEVTADDLVAIDIGVIRGRLEKAAEEMASQREMHFFEAMSKASAAAGTTVDNQGLPLTADTLLKAYGAVDLQFDEQGNAQFPELHVGPDLANAAAAAIRTLHTDPIYNARLKDIIDSQRRKWRDREASRILVG